jgi:Spy/CpxP family protein refolding chaperone
MRLSRRAFRLSAVLVVLLALVWPSLATAQRFKWWQSGHVQRELGLTAEQVTRLEEIFQSYLPSLRKQKESLDASEAEFSRLMAAGDHHRTLAQVDLVEQARAALNKSRALQLVNMRRVLTADQHAKLTAILRNRDRDRDRDSPGAPGGDRPR